jgi:protein SCO1/2
VTDRRRIVLVVVASIALVAAAAATLARTSSDDDGPAAQVSDVSSNGVESPASKFKGALRPAGARAKDFALHDQDGRLVRLSALRGRVVVLSPMYTTCPDTCPLVAQQIQDALLDLPRADRPRVVALALSVDPANDTPESARKFLRTRLVSRSLDFLLGSQAELRRVWQAYGFSPQTRKLEHNSYVVLIDGRGFQRVGFPVNFLTPESLTHDIRLLLHERA